MRRVQGRPQSPWNMGLYCLFHTTCLLSSKKRFRSAERAGAFRSPFGNLRCIPFKELCSATSLVVMQFNTIRSACEGSRGDRKAPGIWDFTVCSIRQAHSLAENFESVSRGLCGRPLDPFAVSIFEGVLFRNF